VGDDRTYQNIQDYTEALLVEFDPTVISYEDVLEHWKGMASPYPASKRQYRTAVWYLNDDQRQVAEEFVAKMPGGKYVDVEPATQFFLAEEYHQNFLEKQKVMLR